MGDQPGSLSDRSDHLAAVAGGSDGNRASHPPVRAGLCPGRGCRTASLPHDLQDARIPFSRDNRELSAKNAADVGSLDSLPMAMMSDRLDFRFCPAPADMLRTRRGAAYR